MLMVTALGLSLVFIAFGMIAMNGSTNWGDMAWIILMVWPGTAGLVLALIGFGVRWIPVIGGVISPCVLWLSIIATLSMVAVTGGSHLLSLVWK